MDRLSRLHHPNELRCQRRGGSFPEGEGQIRQCQIRKPAVPIDKSVKRNEIICLECGNGHKMLKRHLTTSHGLTVEEYRERWGLGRDYPLVAPNYAKQRSELAKKIGLGRKPGAVSAERSKKPAAKSTKSKARRKR